MPQILLPRLLPGTNAFSTSSWWTEHLASQGLEGRAELTSREYAAGRLADVLTLPDTRTPADGSDARSLPVVPSGTVVLAVTEPLAGWLAGDSPDERLDALAAWERELGAWAAEGPTVVATTTTPESLQDLLLLAAGLRAPLLDLTAEQVPPAGREPVGAAADLTAATADQVGETFRAGAISRALGLADAAESAGLALAAAGGVPLEEAERLRAATRETLGLLRALGVRFVGPREALLWPLPVAADAVPLDLVADVALDVLHGVPERIDPVTLGLEGRLAEIDELDRGVIERRRRLAELADHPRNLRRVSGRDLVGLLRRRSGGRRG